MKKYLLLAFVPLLFLSGCSKNATPEQNQAYLKKALSGKFKDQAEKNKSAENLSDYNPEAIDIVDEDNEKVEWTLRQVLQPGKRWIGYSEIGGGVTMPAAVEFTTDGIMKWYGQDATGVWYPGTKIEIEKIAYDSWADGIHRYDGSGEKIEIEGHDEDLDRIDRKSDVEQSIKKVISFGDALDKGFVLSPAAPIDWLPCGEVEVCTIFVDIDGSLMIRLGPFEYNFPN